MSYTGQPFKRLEDPRLVTGQGSYVDDIQLPGMLHAAVLRSPVAHARIRSIDVSAALELPGVISVLVGDEIKGVLKDVPAGRALYEHIVDELRAPEHPVLATEKVVYVGQPVAFVVAQDPSSAQDALLMVRVEYELLPPVVDPQEALREGATPIHEELGTNMGMRIYHEGGELADAFAAADLVIRQQYDVPRLAPAPIEPRGVAADYRAGDRTLTVWDSTQRPHGVRGYLAEILDLPPDQVRVVARDVGGGFGEKGCMFPEEIGVPYLSMLLGRPVKWMESRQENMVAFHGRGHTADVEAAVTNEGIILGLRVSTVVDLGAYCLLSTPASPVNAGHRQSGPYRIPAMSVEMVGAITNKAPNGAYRGAGGPEAAYCVERTVDLIARELHLDPAEVRRRNFISADAFPYATPTGVTYDSGNYQETFSRALELSEYAEWRERARQAKETGERLIGVGLATVVKGAGAHGYRRTDHARIVIDPSGEVVAYTGASPHGQGTETTFAQIVADELGVTPSDVQLHHSDTSLFPAGGGTGASRGLSVVGSTIYTVLQDARHKLAIIASHLLSCSAEVVVFQEGRVFDRHKPERTIPFSQVAAAAYDEELLPPEVGPGLDFEGSYTLPDNPYSFGTHVVVVEVLQETGAVEILRYVAVHDPGRIINPMLAKGQIDGAIAQGLGQALMEGMVFTPDGQPVNGSLMDYALPLAGDIPEFSLDTTETPSPLTPLGAKGIGELPTVAAPSAVVNAVMDALSHLGIRHIETPLTPEKVWRALHGMSQ